jgi:hypothetical protein
MALNNQGLSRLALGGVAASVEALQAAVEITAALTGEDPERFEPNHARHLATLVGCGGVVAGTAGQGGDTRRRAGADQQGQYVGGHAQEIHTWRRLLCPRAVADTAAVDGGGAPVPGIQVS